MNWSDPLTILRASDAFQKIIFTFFGLYLWELFMTCDFEWSLLTLKRRFHWPLLFFLFCRYCMLFAFVGLIISLSALTPINCRALYTFNSWTGNMAILCASTCLMIRTIALWERRRVIIGILCALCFVHWGLLYRGMFVVIAQWDDDLHTCVVVETSPVFLNITFFFTMGFDFIILLFTTVALLERRATKTGLWKLLFQDGLVYFLVSFTMNAIPAVFNLLNLNTPMNVVATIPAASITSIAACRAVIRLIEFKAPELYVHGAGPSSHIGSRRPFGPAGTPRPPKLSSPRAEVHVTTEHITMAEFPITSCSSTPYDGTNPRSSSPRSSIHEDPRCHSKHRQALSEKSTTDSFEYGSPA